MFEKKKARINQTFYLQLLCHDARKLFNTHYNQNNTRHIYEFNTILSRLRKTSKCITASIEEHQKNHNAAKNCDITWCPSLACCCTAPTHCCPPYWSRCSSPPAPWRPETLPRTRPPRCPCSWWGRLCQEPTGYLLTRTQRFSLHSCNTSHIEQLLRMHARPLTELVPDGGGLSRVRWLADTGGVAAADTEAV